MSVVMPPTSSERSRPPVPMACEMPRPALAIGRYLLDAGAGSADDTDVALGHGIGKRQRHPGDDGRAAVGAHDQAPEIRASRFSATSSRSGTLSEKIMTSRPRRSAFRASAAAKSPGTEISARLASGIC